MVALAVAGGITSSGGPPLGLLGPSGTVEFRVTGVRFGSMKAVAAVAAPRKAAA